MSSLLNLDADLLSHIAVFCDYKSAEYLILVNKQLCAASYLRRLEPRATALAVRHSENQGNLPMRQMSYGLAFAAGET